MKRIRLLPLLLVALWLAFSCGNNRTASSTNRSGSSGFLPGFGFDLNDPAENQQMYIKAWASLDSADVVALVNTGSVYSFVDGEPDKLLFNFESYTLSRCVPQADNSYHLLAKKVMLYTDPRTGKILERWKNPYTDEVVPVIHLWNDPANSVLALEDSTSTWFMPYTMLGADLVCMHQDVFTIDSNPLPPSEYPRNSRSEWLETSEMTQLFFSKEAADDVYVLSIPSYFTWTRTTPFLPWMNMGDRPGYLQYSGRGYKILEGGFRALPQTIQDYVMARHPEFALPPDTLSTPNESAWSYYYKATAPMDTVLMAPR